MQLEELTEKSCELLKETLSKVAQSDVAETDDSNFRHAFILSHASCVLQIAEDVLDLEDRGRITSSPLLVRGMLEGLFILGAAARHKDFMGQKVIYDFEKAAEYCRVAAKKTSSSALKEYLDDQATSGETIAKNLRQKQQITEKFKCSPMDCALAADLFRQYAIEYAHYSSSTHGEFFSLFFREHKWTTAHAVRTVAFVCLKAVEFLLTSVKTKESENLAKQLIDLFKVLTELERAGKMKELYLNEMKGQPPITRGKRNSGLQKN